MINGFRCKETERLFNDQASRRFCSIERVARRKLEQRREEQYLQEQIYDVFSDEG